MLERCQSRSKTLRHLLNVTMRSRSCHLAITSTVLIGLGIARPYADGLLRTGEAAVVTADLIAVTGGAIAALLAVVAGRLDADVRLLWLGTALGYFSLVAVPATSAELLHSPIPAPVAAVGLLAQLMTIALLVCAAAGVSPSGGRRAALLVLGTVALHGGVATLGALAPYPVVAATGATPVRAALAVAWLLAIAALLFQAARRKAWTLWYVGVGMSLLAAAFAGYLNTPSPHPSSDAMVALLLLAAVTIALAVTARRAEKALVRHDVDHAAWEEELRIARVQLHRAAERDHELRNGLAGLAGATDLLRSERRGADTETLGSVVASELSRLDELLRPRGAPWQDGPAPPLGYRVAPVLSGLAALRSCAGMDLQVRADPALHAAGSSAVLAQVITNLLGNAAAHAAGSPVRISAHQMGDEVVVRVRDFGPGIPPGHEMAVFECGFRGRKSGGSGLGLHICRELLADQGGSISIGATAQDRPGCTVVVRIPAALPVPQPLDRIEAVRTS